MQDIAGPNKNNTIVFGISQFSQAHFYWCISIHWMCSYPCEDSRFERTNQTVPQCNNPLKRKKTNQLKG